jgi:hypothetical protein
MDAMAKQSGLVVVVKIGKTFRQFNGLLTLFGNLLIPS